MSIKAIEEIERYIQKRERGIPLCEIKRLCDEFALKRDEYESRHCGYGKRTYERHVNEFYQCRREGQNIQRERLS